MVSQELRRSGSLIFQEYPAQTLFYHRLRDRRSPVISDRNRFSQTPRSQEILQKDRGRTLVWHKHLAHKQFLGHPGHRSSRPGTRFLPAGYPDENAYVPWVPHTAHKLLTPGHRSGDSPPTRSGDPPPPGQSPENFIYVYVPFPFLKRAVFGVQSPFDRDRRFRVLQSLSDHPKRFHSEIDNTWYTVLCQSVLHQPPSTKDTWSRDQSLGNGRNTYCFESSVRRERTEPHWALRQTRWVLPKTRWVRFGIQIMTNNRLRVAHWALSPELGEGQKLTELGVWNRTLRNRMWPVSKKFCDLDHDRNFIARSAAIRHKHFVFRLCLSSSSLDLNALNKGTEVRASCSLKTEGKGWVVKHSL